MIVLPNKPTWIKNIQARACYYLFAIFAFFKVEGTGGSGDDASGRTRGE